MDEINGPDVVGILWSETDYGTVFVVKTLALLVPLGKLQAFLTPDALHLLVIDLPAFNVKQFSNLAISVATILFGKTDQRQTQFFVTIFVRCFVLLSGTRNANDTACSPFRSTKLLAGMDDCLTKNLNRQAFGFK